MKIVFLILCFMIFITPIIGVAYFFILEDKQTKNYLKFLEDLELKEII